MKMYEARPGVWLCEGVTYEENLAAWASNYEGDHWLDFVKDAIAENDEARVWVTLDKRRISYDDLSEAHLHNIKAMLKRNGRARYFPNLMAIPEEK